MMLSWATQPEAGGVLPALPSRALFPVLSQPPHTEHDVLALG